MTVIRRGVSNTAFFLEHNRRRMVLLFGVLAVAIVLFGARDLVDAGVSLVGATPALLVQLGFAVLFLIVQFGALFWFISRPRKYVVRPDDPQIGLGFENYRGQPDLLEHARSTVAILRGVREFELRGGEMPKGMLLSGAPGTGKTFLAACIAAEANLPFIYIDASSLRGMFWGMDTMMVIKLFRDARGLARKYAGPGQRGACIVFMDELDSIGMARAGMQGGMGMGMGGMFGGGGFGLNTLLNQMDSLDQHTEDRLSRKILRWLGVVRGTVPSKPLIFVIGATNRPEVLDPALTRPGRLDRMIHVYPPDAEGRRDIIEHYLSQKSHASDIPIELMVSDSIDWTPVMIKTIINEALIVAHEDGREYLTYKDWLAAADSRTLGLKQPIRRMHDDDKRAIAYHEAGHAVAAYYLQPENRVMKATIIRRGGALGVVSRGEREERYTRHARQIETDIMVSLGSRAVEEEILATKMAGASSDLVSATQLALSYCAVLGMGSSLLVVPPTGPLSYPMPTARMADQLLELLMAETKRLVREKAYAVHAVAAALQEKGELIGEELEAVFEAADAAHAKEAAPFQRQLVVLPRMFVDRENAGGGTWPMEQEGVAAAFRPLEPGPPRA
ncbi:MAG TPA: AAA family ATPase [Candidatus Limnocylindrales bacterium]|nr:AAA family ATPase [Candidatus Limnocylindrales bacterium]